MFKNKGYAIDERRVLRANFLPKTNRPRKKATQVAIVIKSDQFHNIRLR